MKIYTRFLIATFLFFVALFIFDVPAYAQLQNQVYSSTGSHTFTVPSGITEITVEAWGGGGSGGSRTGSTNRASGGGGGAYARITLTVTPNQEITLYVGAGSSSTSAGGDSWFMNTATLLAKGGTSANSAIIGVGGSAAASNGDYTFSGGDGAERAPGISGGGGSSAGSSSNGNNGNGSLGGAAPVGGGAGGNGLNSAGPGNPGGEPGGGGGGGAFSKNVGGKGGDGQIIVSWDECNDAVLTLTSAPGTDTQIVCVNTPVTPITYSVQYATGATVSGLPSGVTGSYNNGILTISGTPSTTTDSPFTYTVTTTGSSPCEEDSKTGTTSVHPISVAGTVSSDQTICYGSVPSPLTLSGSVGDIQWQSSGDNLSFSDISGETSATLSISALTATTYYRAVVTSGVCSSATSDVITITVDPISVAGTVSSDQTICYGSVPSPLTLSGSVGDIQWQTSGDNLSFSDISGETSATLSISALTATTYYRAVVTSGVCSSATSDVITITVNPIPGKAVVETTAPTCDADGSVQITNYNSDYTYQFFTLQNVPQVTVDNNGNIIGAVFGVTYNISVSYQGCTSALPNTQFVIEEQLPSPEAAELDISEADCGINSQVRITNYSPNLYYEFEPSASIDEEGYILGEPGDYELWVRFGPDGCASGIVEFTIEEALPVPASPALSVNDPDCENSGTVQVTNFDPELEYIFYLDEVVPMGSSALESVSIDANGLISGEAGNYIVIATNGICDSEASEFSIEEQLPSPEAAELDISEADCGINSQVRITNYSPNLYYEFEPSASIDEEGYILGEPGDYELWVRFGPDGCASGIVEFTIEEALPVPASPALSVNDPDCENSGTVQVTNFDPELEYIFYLDEVVPMGSSALESVSM